MLLTFFNKPIEENFELLIREIFAANGFRIEDREVVSNNEFDFYAEYLTKKYAVEVKFYRTAAPQFSLLRSAAIRLSEGVDNISELRGILVISCELTDGLKEELDKYGLTIFDRSSLVEMCYGSPQNLEKLRHFLDQKEFPEVHGDKVNILEKLKKPKPNTSTITEEKIGDDLILRLTNLAAGLKDSASYESLCESILKYLFPNDLTGWHKQKRTDDGLNRFDYVCRIRSKVEFWEFLIDHLNSKYILFEFKNHSKPVGQGQILTTEKYLLEKALRKVAIVFSRRGADDSAKRMAQGAMREHGKLLLVLGDIEVIHLLERRQNGEDPSDYLFDMADDFLLSLPR